MKRFLSISLAVFCCLCLLVATERRAYAYIDPGTGMMALQTITASLAAAGYFMRRKIAALFGRKKSTESVVIPSASVQAQKDDTRSAA
jgi:hypothetical protein